MTTQPTHDTVTLKDVSGRRVSDFLLTTFYCNRANTPSSLSDSILKFLIPNKTPRNSLTEPPQSPSILARLRSFLPQIAAANEALNSGDAEKLDVDVSKVDSDLDESDTSTDDADSSDEIESDEEQDPKVQFDLSLFRAQRTSDETDTDLRPEVDQLPEGFREVEVSDFLLTTFYCNRANTPSSLSDSILKFLIPNKTPRNSLTEPPQSPSILARLRSFLPQIAAANEALNSGDAEKLDVDVSKVDSELDESDTSTDDADSSDEIESDEEQDPKVQFDLSLFRAPRTSEETDTDLRPEVDQLPEGFREVEGRESCDEPPADKKPKRLVEEL
ncbi:hypothetical protein ANCCAN_14403 [Ancylostoma caninum]|uniref:Uncharacterized protein n=1 Tax=Ancylostoma caninum TaxID=29170 RepID=A0A368G5F0_ANCCA|nr:hypothetical protein ANCCAN_14403 [Ancylostoma caninum]